MAETQMMVGQMVGTVSEAARVMAAPKRVLRDQAGRAVGVEPAL
jgi:hypothetical protein